MWWGLQAKESRCVSVWACAFYVLPWRSCGLCRIPLKHLTAQVLTAHTGHADQHRDRRAFQRGQSPFGERVRRFAPEHRGSDHRLHAGPCVLLLRTPPSCVVPPGLVLRFPHHMCWRTLDASRPWEWWHVKPAGTSTGGTRAVGRTFHYDPPKPPPPPPPFLGTRGSGQRPMDAASFRQQSTQA